jgi:hypothetical protein
MPIVKCSPADLNHQVHVSDKPNIAGDTVAWLYKNMPENIAWTYFGLVDFKYHVYYFGNKYHAEKFSQQFNGIIQT